MQYSYSGDPESLIESLQTGGILITSYNGVLKHKNLLVSSQWHYVILDEGHQIRNPQAKVLIVKKLNEITPFHFLYLHAIFIFIPINRHNRYLSQKSCEQILFFISTKLYYYFVITIETCDWFAGESSGEAILDTASITAEW